MKKKPIRIGLSLGILSVIAGACTKVDAKNEMSGQGGRSADAKSETVAASSDRALIQHEMRIERDRRATVDQDDIEKAQKKLIELGYLRGQPDGILGRATVQGIRQFQAKEALPVTGILTEGTLDRLEDAKLAE